MKSILLLMLVTRQMLINWDVSKLTMTLFRYLIR